MRKACRYLIFVHPMLIPGFLRDYIGLTGFAVVISLVALATIPALSGTWDVIVPENGKLLFLLHLICTPLVVLIRIISLEIPSLKIFFLFYFVVFLTVGIVFLRKPVPWLGSADGG